MPIGLPDPEEEIEIIVDVGDYNPDPPPIDPPVDPPVDPS